MTRHSHHQSPPALRWVAAGCAVLVWVLGLLATSPQLHGALHQEADHADHTCAVTLFSHGVDDTVVPATALFTSLVLLDETVNPYAGLSVAAPRYRLLPGRAPPVG